MTWDRRVQHSETTLFGTLRELPCRGCWFTHRVPEAVHGPQGLDDQTLGSTVACKMHGERLSFTSQRNPNSHHTDTDFSLKAGDGWSGHCFFAETTSRTLGSRALCPLRQPRKKVPLPSGSISTASVEKTLRLCGACGRPRHRGKNLLRQLSPATQSNATDGLGIVGIRDHVQLSTKGSLQTVLAAKRPLLKPNSPVRVASRLGIQSSTRGRNGSLCNLLKLLSLWRRSFKCWPPACCRAHLARRGRCQ